MNKRQKEVLQYQIYGEQAILSDLEVQYQKALNDINKKIRILESDELTQSRIYRLEYQKALKAQVEAVIEKLHSDEYDTIQKFLTASYNDGFLGNMYDMHGQGVPLVFPIDPKQAVEAVMTESKLSVPLYDALGIDTKKLSRTVANEITRGIASEMAYTDIARNIANAAKAPLSRAKTIVRTESHRIQQKAALDAQRHAKSRGADVLKQWDSTLDGDTRPTHKKLDGQIREVEEPFEANGDKAMYPGGFGDPAEDCNCRCRINQRAKWNLGEAELQTLKERAEFFGLDKTEDFEDFKKKYLKAAENERMTKSKSFAVDPKVIDSREYADKFDSIAADKHERRAFLQAAKEILHHRSGQNGEDLYLYNRASQMWAKSTSGTEAGTPAYTEAITQAIKKAGTGELVSFHNHPASMPPSAGDLNAALHNGYAVGYTLCHDGTIFEYTPPKGYIDMSIYEMRIEYFKKKGYNEFDAQRKAIEYLADIYGFTFREVKAHD